MWESLFSILISFPLKVENDVYHTLSVTRMFHMNLYIFYTNSYKQIYNLQICINKFILITKFGESDGGDASSH
jgi:hypothetical protein